LATVLFQTQRILCRQWVDSDLEAIYDVYSDEEGSRWVGDGTPITREESVRWLDVTFSNYSLRGYGMSTLIEKESDEVVGFCGLVHPGGQETAEIKYAFSKSRWGLGYASEVVPAMISYGQNEHGLNRIIATVADGNKASQRVLQKSGLVRSDEYEEDGQTVLVYEWNA
jgi:RimJ/RimL family protein N-acetyltransferase